MTQSVVVKTHDVKAPTAGRLLFKKMFYVRMAEVDALDEEMVKRRGSFTTGFSDIDEKMARRPTQVWRTINDMVELWHDGVEFDLVNGMTDAEKIHNLIQEHLQDCTFYHQYTLKGLRREPTEVTQARMRDLKQLDEFARQIYNRVRLHGKETPLTKTEQVFADAAPILGTDPFGQVESFSRRDAPDYVPIEERIDFSDLAKRKRYRT